MRYSKKVVSRDKIQAFYTVVMIQEISMDEINVPNPRVSLLFLIRMAKQLEEYFEMLL